MNLLLAWRLARRELRGGLAGLRVFLGSLALGVAVIAAVGSLSAAVEAGLSRNARALLGGDIEAALFHRPASAAERAGLAAEGRLSQVAEMRATARTLDGGRTSLIEIKSVDGAYPLYGALGLKPAIGLAAALAERDGTWGAAVAPALLDRLGIKIGDAIRVGGAVLVVRAALTHEPDGFGGGIALGPRVMIAPPALAATGLVQPGTLIAYAYRLRLPPASDAGRVITGLRRAFPDAGWRLRQFGNAAPSLERLLDRVTLYMTLVGLTALFVGGIGIGHAVASYLGEKTATIATLKCLGASRRLIFALYLAECLVLAAGGIVVGLALGALVPVLAAPLLTTTLPVPLALALYPAPLARAAAFGLLITLAFALWPLGVAAAVEPGRLFRSPAVPARALPPVAAGLGVVAAAAALAALAILSASDRRTAAWAVAGAAAGLVLFRLAALAIVALARCAGRVQRPSLRLALANLGRPGAPTAGVLASLGLGLAVLVAIVLVEGNLAREIDTHLPEHAPSFFFIDIQPDQAAAFDRLLKTTPGVAELARVPMLRGRITALNGVPVERARVAPAARWAIESDRGLTYAAALPSGSRLTAGHWWPDDYRGPPLVSFDAGLARGMGLTLGDSLTVNVLGRPVTARIASLREIDWASLGVNFALVFSPGTLEGAPQTDIATARADPAASAALARAVASRFPNVSAIPVKDALDTLSGVLDAVATALTALAATVLAAGVLVLAGAVAAGRRRRIYEAVVLKVLGATRRDLTRVFVIEYGLLGLAAAELAAAMGTLAAWLLLTRVMRVDWAFLPGAVAATAGLAALFTLAVGYLGTWRALGARAAPYLRNE